LRMSRIGDRLSGALPSVGALVVTSIRAGIAGSSSLPSEGSVPGRGTAPAPALPGTGGWGPVVPFGPWGQAAHPASPASTPSGSIHRICPNTSTAILCATSSLARPRALVSHDDGEALDALEASGFDGAAAPLRPARRLRGSRPMFCEGADARAHCPYC